MLLFRSMTLEVKVFRNSSIFQIEVRILDSSSSFNSSENVAFSITKAADSSSSRVNISFYCVDWIKTVLTYFVEIPNEN